MNKWGPHKIQLILWGEGVTAERVSFCTFRAKRTERSLLRRGDR